MGFVYAVLGAGRQGTAAAYDMVRFGDANSVILADVDKELAESAAVRVNQLTGTNLATATQLDVTDHRALVAFLEPVDTVLSAVPYMFNREIAQACVTSRTHMCDLGGNTEVVQAELALDEAARDAGICIVPDCGLQPGMGNTIAVYAMDQMENPAHVRIWVGGLAQHPRPPFDFLLTFHIEGLTNEYDEKSIVLQDGEIQALDAFDGYEEIDFPEPVGRCEAFLTTGGTSTCPWTFEGQLQTYVEKTVRYPGHMQAFRAFRDLGLFGREPIDVGGNSVIPRDFYHELLNPHIEFPDDEDVAVLRVECQGQDGGKDTTVTIDLIDFHDEDTGFRAMERTTGWPPAIIANMMARGDVKLGATPLEIAIPAAPFMAEAKKRGFNFIQTIIQSEAI